jgi:hypothetical protein
VAPLALPWSAASADLAFWRHGKPSRPRSGGRASSGRMRRAALGAGPALALVHGLYAGDRDCVALRDEVVWQRLRRRQGSGPGISAGLTSARHPARFRPMASRWVWLAHARPGVASGDVPPGLALPWAVVTWFVTYFPVLPAKGGPTMAIQINDYSMSLAIGDRIVAAARFSGRAGPGPGRRYGQGRHAG